MAMLDGLRVVFLEALSFVDATEMKRLVVQWNEQCEEVYKYKNALVTEERFKAKSQIDFLNKTITENAQRALEVTLEEIEKAKQEVAREIIGIIDKRMELKTEQCKGVHNEIVLSVYRGQLDAYRDIKEIIKQKYAEGKT